MKDQPEVPPSGAVSPAESSDRDERRLVAAAVRLLMRLPRAARWGLIAAALAGGAELSGGLDAGLEMLFGSMAEVPEVRQDSRIDAPSSRARRPDLRLERADMEALDGAGR